MKIGTMAPKERILAALQGKDRDRLPWSPFLAYFWESQPTSIRKRGQLSYLENIGADPLLRGFYKDDRPLCFFHVNRKKCSITQQEKSGLREITYTTPIGTLKEVYKYTDNGNTWFLIEHPVKTKEDFKILTYINENTSIEFNSDIASSFKDELSQVGNRALHIGLIGSMTTEGAFKSSLQAMVEHWVGTEQLVYALFDYPEIVEEALDAMKRCSIEGVRISAESDAEAFLFWEDSSTTNISPAFFKDYIVPEIEQWADILHSSGKLLIHHACGHIKDLIPIMAETNIDMIESISPPPTGNIELWDAQKLLPERIGLIGGIEPTHFLNLGNDSLAEYVKDTIHRMDKNMRFILANSDSCPPGVTEEKFKLVSKIIKGQL